MAKTRARENHLMDKLGIAPAPATAKPKQEQKAGQEDHGADEGGSETENAEDEE